MHPCFYHSIYFLYFLTKSIYVMMAQPSFMPIPRVFTPFSCYLSNLSDCLGEADRKWQWFQYPPTQVSVWQRQSLSASLCSTHETGLARRLNCCRFPHLIDTDFKTATLSFDSPAKWQPAVVCLLPLLLTASRSAAWLMLVERWWEQWDRGERSRAVRATQTVS